jgi:hypothetical protein
MKWDRYSLLTDKEQKEYDFKFERVQSSCLLHMAILLICIHISFNFNLITRIFVHSGLLVALFITTTIFISNLHKEFKWLNEV